MSADTHQLHQAIENARAALRQGDHAAARRWAEQAARLAPDAEEPWLLLTAVTEPRVALEHAKRALVINPESQRARKAMEWARSRLGPGEAAEPTPRAAQAAQNPLASLPKARASVSPQAPRTETESPAAHKSSRVRPAFLILLAGLICVVVAFAGYSAINSPAVASILSTRSEATPTATPEGPHFVQADFEKATLTPDWTVTPSLVPTNTSTRTPVATFTPTVTFTPEITSTPLPTDTPPPSETPGIAEAAIVPDTPTPLAPPTKPYTAPTKQAAAQPGGTSNGTRWIDVNLSQQMVYAYEGDVVVNSFLASTGTWQTPTVTGSYKIYVKYVSTTMAGPGYYLPNVPYTMYFYKGYGIHGTYWHNNFGTPMSHGCVNLSIPDAEWIYNFASVGTVVNVHY